MTADRGNRISVRRLSAQLRRERRPSRSLREWVVQSIGGRRERAVLFDVLADIDFCVRAGELAAVVGPNGAGKTSLLRVLAGIIPPHSGRVRVAGRIAPLIDLGAGFDPELTGDENVSLYGSILGMTRGEVERRREEAIEFSGLADARDVPVKSYSTGMVARLGFAVATAVTPEVLLIDEVIAVGDEEFRARCFERISALRAAGTAVVLVTHDLPLVDRWADSALHLRDGCQVAFDEARVVTAAYRMEVAA
jgi:ABC-type polysaccharide/polyol phosphate transport system ATPase subunit